MNAYQFDRITGALIGRVTAQPNPATPGEYLLPRNATWTAPAGDPAPGKRWHWNGRVWRQADIPPPPPPPEPPVLTAEQIADAEDREAARAYAKLAALRTMRPAEVRAWVDANVTTLATAQDAIKTLAIAVSILARRI